jgi:hypothetical protein
MDALPNGGPAPAYLTAAETLALIAYGDVRAFDAGRLAPGEPPMWQRWGFVETGGGCLRRRRTIFEMRWILARVRWRLKPHRRKGRCPLPPLDSARRSELRRLWHQHGRRPMAALLKDLAADTVAANDAVRAQAAAVRHASERIGNAISSGQLHPLGRAGRFAARSFASLQHEPVPPAFFANSRAVVTCEGWATYDIEGMSYKDYEKWRKPGNPDWGDLRIPTREAMALWAPKPAPAPRIEDLPPIWTVLRCVVWIALRDAAAVRDCAPNAERPEWVRLPDGRVEMAPQAGDRRWGPVRLAAEWVVLKLDGDAPLGPKPEDAQRELIARLQAGRITATGTPADGSGRRTMTPDDWFDLFFAECGDVLQPEPQHTAGQAWRDVAIARDEMVQAWQPFAETADSAGRGGSPVSNAPLRESAASTVANPTAPSAKSQFSESLCRAWFLLRVSGWPGSSPPPNFHTDRQEAERYFGRSIPRDDFRRIRKASTPEYWRKSGPRGSG